MVTLGPQLLSAGRTLLLILDGVLDTRVAKDMAAVRRD